MATNTSILLIGGSNNGKRVCVPAEHRYLMMRCDTGPQTWPYPEDLITDRVATEQYDRQRICGNSQTFEVFTISGMSADKMIESLIDGYRS